MAAEALAARANELDRNVSTKFFDTAAGTFRDLPIADDGTETEGSPANSWALLFTNSARAHARECAKALRTAVEAYTPANEPDSVSPYQMFYLLMALRAIGEDELAERAIRLVYADMLARPTGTLWEDGGSGQSLVHAWSSGCAAYLAVARLGRDLGFPDPAESVLS